MFFLIDGDTVIASSDLKNDLENIKLNDMFIVQDNNIPADDLNYYDIFYKDEKIVKGDTRKTVVIHTQPIINKNLLLKKQVQAMNDNQVFLEDCIIELAQEVYK